MKYEFRRTITVEGVERKAGDVADVAEIPAGCLVSLMRMGDVREYVLPLPQIEPESPSPPLERIDEPDGGHDGAGVEGIDLDDRPKAKAKTHRKH